MIDNPALLHFNEIAAKWRDLAEKRRQYLVELHSSGRWQHYYESEAQLLLRVRKAAMLAEGWAVLVPRNEPEPATAPTVLAAPSLRQSAA